MALHLLILHLLLWLAPRSSSSLSLESIVSECFSGIDYPFGIPNYSSFRDGFQIACNPKEGGKKMLQLGKTQLKILNISLQGYVRVEVSAITWRCGLRSAGSGQGGLNLERTPYTINNIRNAFTVIGCDALAQIYVPGRSSFSGCASFCVDMSNVIDGSCSGVGCCQASIPEGLKSFQLNFSSIRSLTSSNFHSGLCNKAFVFEQKGFVFRAKDLLDSAVDRPRSLVLDWAIGDETCEVAKNKTSFACKDHSDCYDSPTGGYRCNCSQGYSGNPYLDNGCTDIDECSDPEMNPCVRKCINIPGGFHCPCPLLTTGDGKKQGRGCQRVRLLEITLGAGLGLLFILLITIFGSYWIFQKRKVAKLKQSYFLQNGGMLLQRHISSRQATARIFSAEELERATDNFNDSRVLGRGGYGTVYKGILLDQRVVAIKKARVVDESQIEQFINEVVILSQTNHRNVVKLLGCCLETQVPLLVYEFISNGTLVHHLHSNGSTSSMSWDNRLRIAVETAGALAYLHSAAPIPIIHRDIKSTNILLDENFTAKVSDFGASRLVPYNQTHVTTLVQGTMGYLDPEYFHTSLLTEKSDVYSFGVVLVELLTKEKPVSFGRSECERNLASYFLALVEENRLLNIMDQQTVTDAGAMHLSAVAQLARRCLSVKGEERPRMKEVAVELDALRRLMKQHLAQGKQEEEGCSRGLPSHPSNDDATMQSIMESHVSSSSRQSAMEGILLSSLDLPR